MTADLRDLFAPTPTGSAQCPKCSKFARIVVAWHQDHTGDWSYATECKTCGRQVA